MDLGAVLVELRIGAAHQLDDDVREPAEERRLEPDPGPVLHGAADDAAHDVAAPLVRTASTPSAARNVIARPWSASTRCAFVASSDSPYRVPVSASTQLHDRWNPSVSYTEWTPWRSAAPRSTPRPVSMFCSGRGVSVRPRGGRTP